MYICVDFDGTIVDHCFPTIGNPVPEAIFWMKEWHDCGGKIILFTMRSDGQQYGDVLTQAVDYLEKNGVTLWGVNRNPTQDNWTSSPKAYGHVYVDDAAFGCPLIQYEDFNRECVNWSIVGPDIKSKLILGR